MRKRIFKPITAGTASALIAVTSLLSYGIGLVRDKIIALFFGTSYAADAYQTSFVIPDMLFNIFIAAGLTAAFLPVFTQLFVKDKDEAYELANTVVTGAFILIVIITSLAFVFMDHIIPILYKNMPLDQQKDVILMTRIILPTAIVFTISNALGNILMSLKHFVAYSISPILYNGGIILGILLFKDSFGIYSGAIGAFTGAFLHAVIRIIDISVTEYRYRPIFNFRNPNLFKIIKLMIPKSISISAWHITVLIISGVATVVGEGSYAAYSYARNIQSFSVSLFGIAFATAIFPSLSEAIGRNDKKKYTEHIRKTIQRILFFTIPASLGLIMLSNEVVDLILGGGEFTANSIQMTAIILLFFAISIPFESCVHILARAFYAIKNTITPMIINIIAMVIISLIAYFVASKYGAEWFSIGFSIGLIVQVILLIALLKKHLQRFNKKEFLTSFTKTVIACIVMGIVLHYAKNIATIINPKIAYLIIITIGASVYFLVAFILKSPEISSINYIISRITKKKINEKNT